ncbi:MAG: hypothetical protein KFE23_02285 [Candidatus Baumannia cicadellinicola]|nr:hypothetical protein [Candidatus Baumannia cicadellinicola]
MASRKHELFDQDINELLGSEFSELSDSDDESDVDIFSRVRSGDFIFSELVRDADFNHDLGYLDEPVPGPSGDTVYSNNRPNKPTLDSVDLVINEVVQNYNPRNDFTGNEGTECRPNPKPTYTWNQNIYIYILAVSRGFARVCFARIFLCLQIVFGYFNIRNYCVVIAVYNVQAL